MASNRRGKELGRQKAERQARYRAERRRRQRRSSIIGAAAFAAVVVVVVGIFFTVRGGTDDPATLADDVPTAAPSAGATCSYPTSDQPAARQVDPPPTQPVTTAAGVPATLTLDGQPVELSLDAAAAPCTVNSFASLAQQGYFDDSPCHRLVTDPGLQVLQCGDPSGTGQQGPGYSFADENLTGATYPAGTVAMANSGAGTNGSQFFLVYGDSQLPASYTPFGTITAGLDVISSIAARGTVPVGEGANQFTAPTDPVTIDSVTVDLAGGLDGPVDPGLSTPTADASPAQTTNPSATPTPDSTTTVNG